MPCKTIHPKILFFCWCVLLLSGRAAFSQAEPAKDALTSFKNGLEQADAGNNEQAKNSFNQAINLDYSFVEPCIELAKLYTAENDNKNALQMTGAALPMLSKLKAMVPKLLTDDPPPALSAPEPFNYFDAEFSNRTNSIEFSLKAILALCVQQRFETGLDSISSTALKLIDPLSEQGIALAQKINALKGETAPDPEKYFLPGASMVSLLEASIETKTALRELTAGNYPAVSSAASWLSSRFPKAPYFNYLSGLSACKQKDTPKAIEAFINELFVSPQNANALYACAYLLINEGKASEAVKITAAFLEKSPDSITALEITAYARLQNSDFDGVKAVFEKILKVQPDYPWAFLYLGDYARTQKDDVKTAIVHYGKFLELQPDSAISPFVRIFVGVNSADPYELGLKEDIVVQKKVKLLPNGATVDLVEKKHGKIIDETSALITLVTEDNQTLKIATTAIDKAGLQKNIDTVAAPVVQKFLAGTGNFTIIDTEKALLLTEEFAQKLKDDKIKAVDYPILTELLRESIRISRNYGDTARRGWMEDIMLICGYAKIGSGTWVDGKTAEFVAVKNGVNEAGADATIIKLEKLKGLEFTSAELPLSIGMLYYEKGDFRSAILYFEQGLKFNLPPAAQKLVADMLDAARKNKPCTACKGLGILKCLTCGGTGRIKCPVCFGSGTVAPSKIGVMGDTNQKVPCKACGGLKFGIHKPCNGRGWTDCRKCAKKNVKVVPLATCRTCNGTGIAGEYIQETCAKCAGLGVVNE